VIAHAELVRNVLLIADDDQFAFGHDGDSFGEVFCLLEVVSGQDDAAVLALDGFEDGPDGLSGVGI
jgi:hypothetical protein